MDRIYIESLTSINNVRRLAPWSVAGRMAVAKVHCGMNQFKLALPYLKLIIQQNFDLRKAYELLSLCYKRLGKSYEEVPELAMASQREPTSALLNHRMGEAYLREKDYNQTREYFQNAIKQQSGKDTGRQRAMSYVGLGYSISMQACEESNQRLQPFGSKGI